MNSEGWQEADYRELEMMERFNMVIYDEQLTKQFDEVFGSHYYNELDMQAAKRWQELTGDKR